jgi:anti-sigma B factor antagonist
MEEALAIPHGITVRVEKDGRRAALILTGELDLASAEMLSESLQTIEASRPSVIALDLRQLQFMDSTGLLLAIRAHTRARREGRRFVIVPGPPQVQKVFALTGLDSVLEFDDGPEPSWVEQAGKGVSR